MQEVATCIYCEETKSVLDFNREHVVPEAFGKFEGNFVLHKTVCQPCNSYFDKELDLPLARDSKEGLDRFVHKIAEPKLKRKLGSRVSVEIRGGVLDGAPLRWELDPTGTALGLTAAAQIGFSARDSGPFEWYAPDQVPPVDELRARGLLVYVSVGGMPATEAQLLLERLGIKREPLIELPDPRGDDGMLNMTLRGVIDQRHQRAIAKIAFNYFAYHYLPLARLDQYRSIRRYVRFDEQPQIAPVSVSQESIIGKVPENIQLVAHVVTVRWDRATLQTVAQVTLFGWLQYRVTLSTETFAVPPFVVGSGHVFNQHAHRVMVLTRDPSKALKNPPMMTKEAFALWKDGREGLEGSSSRSKARKRGKSRRV